ncbi:hypothetical protein Y695_02915 [Hydrogenophaga sp. T4]|nr:hypothetical protein Y695_02915 [Hydrogenophaga sp. T4]
MKASCSLACSTRRARTEASLLSGVVRSSVPARWFQLPSSAFAVAVKVLLFACLRTRLMAADGSPAPFNRPVEPRTTSIRSKGSVLMVSAPMLPVNMGTPSNW